MSAETTAHPLPPGLIIAAPASGSGKTTITLGLLRGFRNAGVRVASFKSGPDYIDPMFHAAASGVPCRNLDTWAMDKGRLANQIASVPDSTDLIIAEGVMGLFDGAADDGQCGNGSAAGLSRLTGWPVLLVVDASAQAQSVAALAHGFATFDQRIRIAGIILNRVGSERHDTMLRQACAAAGIKVAGSIRRDDNLAHPDRHLGLVPAAERTDLEAFLDRAGTLVASGCDLDGIRSLAAPLQVPGGIMTSQLIAPGPKVAVAQDAAFCFIYDHVIADWRDQGGEITFFSPLAGEMPDEQTDAVWFPGGYPELHAATLSSAKALRTRMREFHADGKAIFGECGGYMFMGEYLTDSAGKSWPMLGLLPISTDFSKPRLHLGYRTIETLAEFGGWSCGQQFTGHEFHYAREGDRGADARPLFLSADSSGQRVVEHGCFSGTAAGSFLHLIDSR